MHGPLLRKIRSAGWLQGPQEEWAWLFLYCIVGCFPPVPWRSGEAVAVVCCCCLLVAKWGATLL